ncbi:hypothetical protein N9L68_03210 [bacterium]|nr:hypothetical protein [bacterium]
MAKHRQRRLDGPEGWRQSGGIPADDILDVLEIDGVVANTFATRGVSLKFVGAKGRRPTVQIAWGTRSNKLGRASLDRRMPPRSPRCRRGVTCGNPLSPLVANVGTGATSDCKGARR